MLMLHEEVMGMVEDHRPRHVPEMLQHLRQIHRPPPREPRERQPAVEPKRIARDGRHGGRDTQQDAGKRAMLRAGRSVLRRSAVSAWITPPSPPARPPP